MEVDMLEFALGVVVGAAFAPFWVMVYTTWIKPQVEKLTGGRK
jgi:large-conductance mechanosensitive channel